QSKKASVFAYLSAYWTARLMAPLEVSNLRGGRDIPQLRRPRRWEASKFMPLASPVINDSFCSLAATESSPSYPSIGCLGVLDEVLGLLRMNNLSCRRDRAERSRSP